MGLINWIFDIYQHTKIDRAEQETERLRAEMASLRTNRGDVDQERLVRAIGELALAVKTVQRRLNRASLLLAEELDNLRPP